MANSPECKSAAPDRAAGAFVASQFMFPKPQQRRSRDGLDA